LYRFRYLNGAVLLIVLAGCAISDPSALPPDGYVRLKQIEGCWQHSKPREFNIALGPDLEQLLRAQLEGRGSMNGM
jgi:hypothetical protein